MGIRRYVDVSTFVNADAKKTARAFFSAPHGAPKGAEDFPPYNLEMLNDGTQRLRITLAVPGFRREQLDVTFKENRLVITGRTTRERASAFVEQGIPESQFTRTFLLDEAMRVGGADLADGLLSIDIAYEVTEGNPSKAPYSSTSKQGGVPIPTNATSVVEEFTPSDDLIEIAHNGLLGQLEILRASSSDEASTPPSFEYARAILAGRIFEVIASRARRVKLGVLSQRALSIGNAFDYGFVQELSDHIPIRIDQGTEFFSYLLRELTDFLRRGGRVAGRWGQLTINDDGITISEIDDSGIQSTAPLTATQANEVLERRGAYIGTETSEDDSNLPNKSSC
ncbi:Hsp20 family protein [Bradyrhizobium sp. DASA03076]|uniref:Hsp20 family protein n=1 Tax=Bradyrhizobium sp. BLXBL-03 TaxID=3395916 RepID=UPI003F6E987A